MPLTGTANVRSEWVGGNLVFTDLEGNPILTLNQAGAIQLGGGGVNVETLDDDKALVVGDAVFQKLDPGGSSRDVVLPAAADSAGLFFRITNAADAAESLVVLDDATSVAALGEGEAAWFACDGTAWVHMGIETVDALSPAASSN
jgi:hypothetical protein